jgi:cytochrome oxidase assembly protein ShyY1
MLKFAFSFKWLGALLLCLVLAGSFAALAQWQVTRSVVPNSDNDSWDIVKSQPLTDVAQIGKPFTFNEISKQGKEKVLTEVSSVLTVDPTKAVLIANRIQVDGRKGFWLVVPSTAAEGKLFVAAGFIESESAAHQVLAAAKKLVIPLALLTVQGRYIPSEAPEQSIDSSTFATLSVAQLINRSEPGDSLESQVYAGALALTQQNQFSSIPNLELITIGLAKADSQVNWLSAFYAIEWSVFAGFALFIWWRMLTDAYIKQQSKMGK